MPAPRAIAAAVIVALAVVPLFAALAVLTPAPASAYVRTLTKGEPDGSNRFPAYWNHPIIPIVVHLGSPPAPLTADQILRATRAAAAAWSRQAIACSQMELRVVPDPSADALAVSDRVSHLIFRDDVWCKKPPPANGRCYDRLMLAVTSVFMRKSDGRILDADIEVNAVSADWSDIVADPNSGESTQDLQGALTHEFGHLLGFEHSCLLAGDEMRVDDQGQVSPSCAFSADPKDSVMIASVGVGKHIPRTLSDDDIRGVCAVYPPVGKMVPGDHAGCAISPPGGHRRSGVPLLLASLGALLIVVLSAAARRRWPRPGTGRR
jgi:hypothetical protein